MRLDQHLLARGLAPSRARAQALIKAGAVRVDGAVETKPSRSLPEGAALSVDDDPNPWVSRAGLKLAHALEAFALSPAGATVLDIGASTGGFTEVCLASGAARVYAVDVGRDQLHPSIAADPRVTALSGVNAKALDARLIPELVDWVVADVSFISLEKALPAALALTKPAARLVALVKPQFEVGRSHLGKGGLVKDPATRSAAVQQICRFLGGLGWSTGGQVDSPITGGDGNVEYLITAQRR